MLILSYLNYFRKLLQEILAVEFFLWSNYRLTVKNGDYVLKRLHQECFLENFPKAFGVPKYHILQIVEINLFLVARITSCGRRTFAYINLYLNHIFFS